MTKSRRVRIKFGAHIVFTLALFLSACERGGIPETVKAQPSQIINEVSDFTVTILGSGTPIPSRTQAGTAILVEAGARRFLFDCGRGCTTRLAAYDPTLAAKVDKMFLTHLHSDHVVGIPDLWLNGWTSGRKVPLQVWGPIGVAGMMEGLRQSYAADLINRRAGPDRPVPLALQDRITTLAEQGGVVFESAGVKVTAFRVNHADLPAYGYRVDYDGRSVILSGDTSVTPNLSAFGGGADVVLLEVVSPAMLSSLEETFPPEFVKVVLGIHLMPEQASKVFADIAPKLGVYYHTVTGCETDKALLEMTGKIYTGPVEVARDLMKIHIFPDRVKTELLGMPRETCQ